MANSPRGWNTGWCTVGEETAAKQLAKGEFHIFYSKGDNGENKIPRVAVRMENGEISEVRGIEEEQNLEACMADKMISLSP